MAKTGYKSLKKQNRKASSKSKKGKTFLPKGQNITDTNFKVKKVVIRDQVHQHKEGEILNKKNISYQELIGRLTHHNSNIKQEALSGLKDLLNQYSKQIIETHLANLIESVSKLTLDESNSVRKDANKLLTIILSQISLDQVAPLFPLLVSYLMCGLTHIDNAIREDFLFLLDTLLKYTPQLCANSVPKLLPVCLDLLSTGHSGTRMLSMNLESKLTSVKWRVIVLARISALLLAYLNSSKENEMKLSKLNCKKVYFSEIDSNSYDKYYFSLFDTSLNYDYDRNNLLNKSSIQSYHSSEEFQLKDFSEVLIPLLFEAFIELVPVEKNIMSSDPSTSISSEVALVLKYVTNILHTLWNLCDLANGTSEEQKWMRNKFGKLFMESLIENRYPYNFTTSTDFAKRKKCSNNEYYELPSVLMQNILLAKLLITLTAPIHWKPAVDYLKGCLRMSESFSVEESSLLISCYYKLCTNRSENVQDFLVALKKLSNSKNRFLSSQAFNVLYEIAINPDLSYLHSDDNFTLWLVELPEKLTKASISSRGLDMIFDIARRNFPAFSESLNGLIEVILDKLPFLKIDGSSREEGLLKVAQLLFWVTDWDSEMIESLSRGVETKYWGISVSNQIRDIISIKKV